ncbi:hypothetical protein M569_02831, partial [Genlisea aurea]
GLIVVSFGPSYSYSLMRLLYGQKWSDGEASTVLQFYCLYVILLAMNGTSEAFLHAVATEHQLKQSNDTLLVFSVIYVVLNVLLIRRAGAVGLILANSLNMIFRIAYSGVFIRKYFKDTPSFSFKGCMPGGSEFLLVTGVATVMVERMYVKREEFWFGFGVHLCFGLGCLAGCGLMIFRREKAFFNKIIRSEEHVD